MNADNLVTLTSIPGFLNVNARSLNIEKLYELLVVARMTDFSQKLGSRAARILNISDYLVCVVKGRTGWRQEVEEKRVVWQRPWFVL